jgi:glycosyltransferase involved in cell wall biosynthesis
MSDANVDTQRGQDVLVSFIVPALNEEKHISQCLTAIQRLLRPAEISDIEIIVVDNQSTDGTVDMSREFGATIVTVSPGRPSRARNAGAAAARGVWLAFVDADCELAPNWLTTCAANMLGDQQVLAVAGAMCPPASNASWVERAWYELACVPPYMAAKPMRWLPTFNILVRRDAFERAGGFDESLCTCEDCDLSYKLVAFGKLILDSRTHAIHRGESRSLGELFRREAWRTSSNLRLALTRPFDLFNWLGLLVPPCIVTILLLSVIGAGTASVTNGLVWPWMAVTIGITLLVALIVVKKSANINLLSFPKQMIVFITYLAARATGLIWAFPRVQR